jgi:hypothetical protein
MKSHHSAFLVSTTLFASEYSHEILSVLTSEKELTEDECERYETTIAASLDKGSMTDIYDNRGFEAVDGIVLAPNFYACQKIKTDIEMNLLRSLPQFSTDELDDCDSQIKSEVEAYYNTPNK